MRERESLTRCLALLGGGVVVAAALLVGVGLGMTLFLSEADTANQTPSSGSNPLRIVALGDGFMSGEGATGFFPGTDKPGRNQCRRTASSFPYLVVGRLAPPPGHDGISLTSAACSGAATTNVASFAGIVCTEAVFPDGCPAPLFPYTAGGAEAGFQIDAVAGDTDVVLVMVGAKDAQLRDAIALCVAASDPCGDMVSPFVAAMGPMLEWRIGRVLAEVAERAPGAARFALTYPSLLGERACAASRLDQDETEFIDRVLLTELNRAIAAAARSNGARLIDLTRSLGPRRICSADGSGSDPAASAFQVRPIRAISTKPSAWFHGSFYPNELGHRLMAGAVGDELAIALEQLPDPAGGTLTTDPPPFAAGPADPGRYEHDSTCDAGDVRHQTVARPTDDVVRLEGLEAGAAICFRGLLGRWQTVHAESGTSEVPLPAGRGGISGWSEVLYRSNGEWKRMVLVSTAGPGTAELPLARAWTWPWLVTMGGIVAHPVIAGTLVLMALGGGLMWCARKPRPPKDEGARVVAPRGAR